MSIVTIREGVQFEEDAAYAFMRAEHQLGRQIDVNSTWRPREVQLAMYEAWQRYLRGGPHPGHSKALHPDDPLAFHTTGLALDSDDWTNAHVVAVLAEHGFVRNRLYVANEQHHFEYLAHRDQHQGEDMFTDEDRKKLDNVYAAIFFGGVSMKDGGRSISQTLADIASGRRPTVSRWDDKAKKNVSIPWIQELADAKTLATTVLQKIVEFFKRPAS